MAKKKTIQETRRRVRGFRVAYGFKPAGFATRIKPPYFETTNSALANAIAKAKGSTELTPAAMEDFKTHLRLINPALRARQLAEAEQLEQADLEAAKTAAAAKAAEANTKAAAAAERAAAAQAKLAELGGGADDEDLFGAEEGEESGVTLKDLPEMAVPELLAVLAQLGIEPPKVKTRETLLMIAKQVMSGELVSHVPDEKADETSSE